MQRGAWCTEGRVAGIVTVENFSYSFYSTLEFSFIQLWWFYTNIILSPLGDLIDGVRWIITAQEQSSFKSEMRYFQEIPEESHQCI